MEEAYAIFDADRNWDYCTIEKTPRELRGNLHLPAYGLRMGGLTQDPLLFQMSARFPGIVAPDCVRNTPRYLMVSDRFKELLQAHVKAEMEVLPMFLVDHKGHRLERPYFIINLIGRVDCVDLERSEYVLDPLSDEGEFQFLTRLVLDTARIPPEANFFRIQQMPHTHIVRRDLALLLEQQGLTGYRLSSLGAPIPP